MSKLDKFNKKQNTSKIFFNGKSYKLSVKRKLYNFRFNRSNKTIMITNNVKMVNYRGQKKLYIYNIKCSLLKKKLNEVMFKVRKYNTHTLRGLHTNNTTLNKRVGRISGYM